MTDNENLTLAERQFVPRRRTDRADSFIDVVPSDMGTPASLGMYWEILSKRRWEIVSAALTVLTAATLYSFKMKPIYRATARVEIEAEAPEIQSLTDLYRNMVPTDESFLKTQVQVLQSDNLIWRTIQQLALAGNSRFARSLATAEGQPSDSEATKDLLIGQFRRSLNVVLAPNSRIVEVSFESTDKYLAAEVVNTLIADYLEYNFHKKYDATRQAGGWMEQQLDELKAKVEKSQQALVDYERHNAIINVNDKQNILEQRLEDLSRDLTIAENDGAQKESLYELVKANEAQVALLAQNELLQRLEEKYADFRAQYLDALGQYGPNFPKVMRLRDQVNEIQSLIDSERKRTVARIRNDYLSALGRERLLAASVARQRAKVENLNQLLIQHNMLKREFETNQQLYESLLKHLKDATVSAGLRANNIHVLDTASPPTLPARPKKVLNIAVGLIVGLLLGVTIAFVRESVDYSIKTTEQVEGLIGIPSLAIIPRAGSAESRLYGLSKAEDRTAENGAVTLAILQRPNSILAESYRALRTSVLFSTAPRPPKTVLVTSAQPNEGKTCTSVNLALALAQQGARVLIIDADLRNPGVAKPLRVENGKGLSGVLTGAYSLGKSLHQVGMPVGLSVLAAGPRPPNPAELLSSPAMRRTLHELNERFDHIVLDSPPLLMVTDATILSTLVDGVILVVESGVTSRDALSRAHKTIKIAGSRVLGVVLNKVNLRQNGYGSYYARYYSSPPELEGKDPDRAVTESAVPNSGQEDS